MNEDDCLAYCNNICSLVLAIEDDLYQWFLNQRLNYKRVNDEMFRFKAMEFHRNLNIDISFTASHGWIQKFKKRHFIRLLKICGEKLSSNSSVVPGFINSFINWINKPNYSN